MHFFCLRSHYPPTGNIYSLATDACSSSPPPPPTAEGWRGGGGRGYVGEGRGAVGSGEPGLVYPRHISPDCPSQPSLSLSGQDPPPATPPHAVQLIVSVGAGLGRGGEGTDRGRGGVAVLSPSPLAAPSRRLVLIAGAVQRGTPAPRSCRRLGCALSPSVSRGPHLPPPTLTQRAPLPSNPVRSLQPSR